MENIPSIEELVSDRGRFNSFVYTPVIEAVNELNKRSLNQDLSKKVLDLLDNDLPAPFKKKPAAVFFGYATPNYEIRRFISIVDVLESLQPLFLEYIDDKFVPENDRKFSLAKLKFFNGFGKNGGKKIDRKRIIDFYQNNGKKISQVKTLWGQSLMDFHHELFEEDFMSVGNCFYDISSWLGKSDYIPSLYYKNFFRLFIQHGILFENFMLDEKESEFTKTVVLPAFLATLKETGHKPLIVALEPTDIEGDEFWLCYPSKCAPLVEQKMHQCDSI